MLLNGNWVAEETKKEIKNKNGMKTVTTTKSLEHTKKKKAVLRRMFIVLNVSVRKF